MKYFDGTTYVKIVQAVVLVAFSYNICNDPGSVATLFGLIPTYIVQVCRLDWLLKLLNFQRLLHLNLNLQCVHGCKFPLSS